MGPLPLLVPQPPASPYPLRLQKAPSDLPLLARLSPLHLQTPSAAA